MCICEGRERERVLVYVCVCISVRDPSISRHNGVNERKYDSSNKRRHTNDDSLIEAKGNFALSTKNCTVFMGMSYMLLWVFLWIYSDRYGTEWTIEWTNEWASEQAKRALKIVLNSTIRICRRFWKIFAVNESQQTVLAIRKRSANNIYPKLNMYVDSVKVYIHMTMIPLQEQNRTE